MNNKFRLNCSKLKYIGMIILKPLCDCFSRSIPIMINIALVYFVVMKDSDGLICILKRQSLCNCFIVQSHTTLYDRDTFLCSELETAS